MKKLVMLLFIVIVASVVATVVAAVLSKNKLSGMSDEEIRELLATKIGTRVGEDQLASIQDAVIAGVRKGVAAEMAAADSLDDAADHASDADDDAAAAGDAGEAVVDAAAAIIEEASN
jgi:ATP phosphoribosyltransferase regulatory subunit HisZ